jgi:hypothetical protein
VLTDDARKRLLAALLRLEGAVTALGFFAVFLPVDWMASTHRFLGLGEFPRTPIVDYLTRSIAALYGFHGGLLLIVAGDPYRYKRIVQYLALVNVGFGLTVLAIDLRAGMPALWTLGEGPPMIGLGILVWMLIQRASAR